MRIKLTKVCKVLSVIATQQEAANINSNYNLAAQQVIGNINSIYVYTEKPEGNRRRYFDRFLLVLFSKCIICISDVLSISILPSHYKLFIFNFCKAVGFKNYGILSCGSKFKGHQKCRVKSTFPFLASYLVPLPEANLQNPFYTTCN